MLLRKTKVHCNWVKVLIFGNKLKKWQLAMLAFQMAKLITFYGVIVQLMTRILSVFQSRLGRAAWIWVKQPKDLIFSAACWGTGILAICCFKNRSNESIHMLKCKWFTYRKLIFLRTPLSLKLGSIHWFGNRINLEVMVFFSNQMGTQTVSNEWV